MLRRPLCLSALALLSVFLPLAALAAQSPNFAVSYAKSVAGAQPLDGRLYVVLSTNPADEPRHQINDGADSQILFGVDVDGLKPGQAVTVDERADGYPVRSLRELKPGDYYVQAVLHLYETFHRADGKTVKLPMDRGEGQHWDVAPGNLYSKPQFVRVAPGEPIKIVMDQVMPPIAEEKDTKYVRHLRIQSELLTKFWGRPMFLSAIVLVPEGFDEHPEAHYPEMIFHDHFVDGIHDFRTTPPDANPKPEPSERFHLTDYNRIQQEESYKNYQQWIAPGFPRFLVIKVNHANQYYDDSYAVNSANLGPWGDAIEKELLPAVEKKFRGIGQGWARFTYGGSTGGWEAMAVQVFNPDYYNGAYIACPDPVDFRAYEVVNIYEDKNAFYKEGPHKRIPQPAMRDYLGRTLMTQEDSSAYEAALGSHDRSGEQLAIWEAVFGPVGDDGYPKPLWDKHTGVIDKEVAAYWKEHFDLRAILEKNWSTLGPKLRGKLNLYVGSADTYFLNDAVYYMEDFLKSTKNPPYDGEVKYGERAEHCWNGDPTRPNYITRLHYNTMYLDKIMKRIADTAPQGADLTSWRY